MSVLQLTSVDGCTLDLSGLGHEKILHQIELRSAQVLVRIDVLLLDALGQRFVET